MEGIRPNRLLAAPGRHSPIAGTTQPAPPEAGREVAKAAPPPPRARSLGLAAFPPLGPPRLASDPELPLVLSGLKPGVRYAIVMARPHPEPNKSLIAELTIEADSAGTIDLGAIALRRALGREPTPAELRYGGTIALKLMDEKPTYALAPTQLRLLPAMKQTGDRVLISAQPLVEGPPAPPAVLARQDFYDVPEGAVRSDFDPRRDGMVGYTLLPKGASGKLPTVVVWGGSGGNIPDGWANYLVSQGFAVVALRYFTYDAKDPNVANGAIHFLINELPLERFARAVTWAKAQPFCDTDRLSVLGESRGGEAALLVAQHFGNRLGLENVVPLRPLDIVVGSKINGADFLGEPELSSWTVGGKPLPFVAKAPGVTQPEEAIELARKSGKLRYIDWNGKKLAVADLRAGFDDYLPRHSTIDVTEFAGRIISVGGDADAMWPAELAVRRVAAQRRGRDDVHVNIRGAGHYTAPGQRSTAIPDSLYLPVAMSGANAHRSFLAPNGGTPERNALYDVLNQLVVVRGLRGEKVDTLPFNELVERPA